MNKIFDFVIQKIHIFIIFRNHLWKYIIDHIKNYENYEDDDIDEKVIINDIKKLNYEFLSIIIEYSHKINLEFYRYLIVIFRKNHLLNKNI